MPSPDKILVLGAAFVDVIMKVPSLPVSGEDVTGILQSYEIGGSAFNVFGALKYTNAKADLFVPIGNGPYANMVKKAFASNNLPIMIADSRSDNGWDLCLIEPNGERSFITIQGIEQLWTSSWFDEINLDDYKYFYISGYEIEDDNVSKIILAKLSNRRADSYVLFDSSPRIKYLNSQVIDQLLSRNVLIHCNQSELEYLSHKETLDEKLLDIYKKTNTPVIVTLGEMGTLIYDSVGKRLINTSKTQIVNTIGAGDTHCGGILSGLQRGMKIDDAVTLGNKLSAKVVSQQSGCL